MKYIYGGVGGRERLKVSRPFFWRIFPSFYRFLPSFPHFLTFFFFLPTKFLGGGERPSIPPPSFNTNLPQKEHERLWNTILSTRDKRSVDQQNPLGLSCKIAFNCTALLPSSNTTKPYKTAYDIILKSKVKHDI